MSIKKIVTYIKNLNSSNIIAIVFLVAIFYIATMEGQRIFKDVQKSNKNIITALDDGYQKMLEHNTEFLIDKGTYVNLNGLMARLMGQKESNGVLKLNNGQIGDWVKTEPGITNAITQLTKLYEFQEEKGGEFLFALAPFQISNYEDLMPTGYVNYPNIACDKLLAGLETNEVPYLDFRKMLHEEGINHKEAYFDTDHHWRPETGFWAYGKLIDYFVENKFMEAVDPKLTDKEQFNFTIADKRFLGSGGRRTGIFWGGLDEIAIVTPKFETSDMVVSIPISSIENEGSFYDIAYQKNVFDLDGYFTSNLYGAYGNGDRAIMNYTNKNAPSDVKVMVIGDSFTNSTTTYFSLIFKEYLELDLRYDGIDFMEQYEAFKPDVIVVLIGGGVPSQKNTTYDFLGEE